MGRRRARRSAVAALAVFAAWVCWQLRSVPALDVPDPWPGLVDVTVINPERGRRANQTILFRGDRIESIRDAGAADPRDVRSRFFAKRYVIPGLIDLDVRQPPPFMQLQGLAGLMYLVGGVTTVRDVGNFDGDQRATQAAIRDGSLVYPRLIACVRMLEGDPATCAQSRVVRDAADAARAVDEIAASGGQCVHMRSTVPAHFRAAIDAAARSRQLPVVTAEPSSTAYIPMLAPWHLSAAAAAAPGEPFQTYLPSVFRTVIWPAQLAHVAPAASTRSLHDTIARRALAGLTSRAAGIPLRLGSGAPSLYAAPGGGARIELEYLMLLGLTREEAWAAATRGAGELLGIPQLGTVEPGAPADLLVFREDPTQRSEAMRTLEAVISRGRLYPSRTLLGQILEHVRYQDRWLVKALRNLQARWLLWWKPATVLDCQLP